MAKTREERVFVFNPNLAIKKKRIITKIVMINADVKSRAIFEHLTFKIEENPLNILNDVNKFEKSYHDKKRY